MPRKKKCRKICREPEYNQFQSMGSASQEVVVLNVEEYEVIRLLDFEKYTQEECATQMEIARTTVTDMYERARFKIADCIVNGKSLQITGGTYEVCDGEHFRSCRKKCHHNCRKIERKGGRRMKIAVPVEENRKDVCPSFGRTPYFLIYNKETSESKIIENPAMSANGGAGGQAAQLLVDEGVDVLITPRCGENAAEVLNMAEVKIYKSNDTDAQCNIEEYMEGKLEVLTKFHAGFHGIV